MEAFGDRVRRARLAQGWATYRAADQATGIPSSTWQNIEARGKDPRLTTVQRLLDVLGVACDELLACPVMPPNDPDVDPEADPAARLGPDPGPGSLGGSGAPPRGRRGRRRGSGSTRL